ncbi:MAG: hypothetical protein ACM32E_26765 [Gemmatimonadota bacterium]
MLARRHWLFSLALLAGVVLRVVAMLGFRPAILFGMDSYDYLWGAVHVSPDLVNPSGYSLFLWLLRPLHSLALVAALQHVMGLAIAAMVYAVLRRYGLPAWGATLAALPALIDPAQLLVETLVMADLLAMTAMVAALAVLLLRETPSLARSVTAGLLMGVSAAIRPTTLPLVLGIPLFLLARRAGWRRAGAALAAGALPVLGYMGWFASAHGSLNLSESNGLFLWSRTMSFANCAVIRPPADLRALCPTAQGGYLSQPVPGRRPPPKRYLWSRSSWAWQHPPQGIVPDKVPFTPANNARALRFAVRAITAQPLAYAATVGRETLKPFTTNDRTLRFPARQTRSNTIDRPDLRYAVAAVSAYAGPGRGQAIEPYVSYHFATRLHQPFAYLMKQYQSLIFLPGPGLGLIAAAGLAGIALPRRRTAAAVFLWLSAAVIIVLPIAEHEYTYRYAIPAVPLLCIAAALAFRRPPAPAGPAQVPAQGQAPAQAPAPPPEAAAPQQPAQGTGGGPQPG